MLSIFTTATNPFKRGDLFDQAINCYKELADELIIVDGKNEVKPDVDPDWSSGSTLVWFVHSEWPQEFEWPLIGQKFQKGYEQASEDWVIHADLDFIFHEDDFNHIHDVLKNHDDKPALSFFKYQFILPDRYNLKSRLVIAVNKGKYGDRIRFDSGGDLCQPSLDGKYIEPKDVPEARVPIYNYEKILKTKEQIAEDQGRMERAWMRHFGTYHMSKDGTDEDAYNKWIEMQKGRIQKSQNHIKLEEHPKYMQETIRNLQPHQFGYNGFDELGVVNDYLPDGYKGNWK